ncbi:hypothetical protein BS47DRAFT_248530 [Hydnum rufescens UP504]|uniref:Uncharacterized protein n=1 Tax=Hydnum rufescens UP504 TaxID=1448309 RepID=A0A9P6AMA9_9AGAM|nr:hypothetical protein BS47DRAFT_248530 [Hydnum rufescens UP504]
MASSSINIRVSDEWARTPRSERQYISEIAAQDYVAQASWRGAADPGSTVSNYPHSTPLYRPPTTQLLPPESRTSQVAYNQPEMYSHPSPYAQDARFIHLNASNQPLVENPGHDTRYAYSSVPGYPTNAYPHVINPPSFTIESNTSPPARSATSTITIEPGPRDEERRQQVYVQSPIPVPFTPPAPNPSARFRAGTALLRAHPWEPSFSGCLG